MSVEENIRSIHKEIQQNINVMLPEKYKKLCLYASIIDGHKVSTGEMFFYYFPSGILKKNPINVYEIPSMFDYDEEQYANLEKRLYESIRKLRRYCIRTHQRPWSNVTITMEGTKYVVEYNYDDLISSEFNNYERHIIWRYKYLKVPIESYSKKEKEVLKSYFESLEYKNYESTIYEDGIYEKQANKVTVYDSVESHDTFVEKQVEVESTGKSGKKNQLLNF